MGKIKLGLRHRLLGFKVMEQSDHHVVMRLPWWTTEAARSQATVAVADLIKLTDKGQRMRIKIKRAGRVLRYDWEVRAPDAV